MPPTNSPESAGDKAAGSTESSGAALANELEGVAKAPGTPPEYHYPEGTPPPPSVENPEITNPSYAQDKFRKGTKGPQMVEGMHGWRPAGVDMPEPSHVKQKREDAWREKEGLPPLRRGVTPKPSLLDKVKGFFSRKK